MILALLFGLTAVTPQAVPESVRFRDRVETADAVLLLSEAADLSALPRELQARAGSLQLATLPPSLTTVVLDHKYLASRARSLLPALSPWLRADSEGQMAISRRDKRKSGFRAACGADGLQKGQMIPLNLSVSGIMIERTAEVMQSAKPGQKFFARAADGDVLTAICEGIE